MTLTQLFPWSAEARVLNYVIDQWTEDSEKWISMADLRHGSGVSYRNISPIVYKLTKMGILQIYRYVMEYGHRKVNHTNFVRIGCRLKLNDLTVSMLRFHTELAKNSSLVTIESK